MLRTGPNYIPRNMQTCTKCNKEKALEHFEFRRDTQRYRATCKLCRNEKSQSRYIADPAYRETVASRNEKYRLENDAKVRAQLQAYHIKTKEKRNAVSLEWARANKDVAAARSLAWRLANPGKQAMWDRIRRDENPEPFRTKVRNRRAKLRTTGSHTAQDIKNLMVSQAMTCNGCRCDLNLSSYHVDHVVAVENGGSNGPENLQLLCPTCNVSKGTKDMSAWMRSKGYK